MTGGCMTRITILSDIHGNIPALEAVLADMQNRPAEMVVVLGDLVSGPLWPAETAELLMKQNWVFVAGNHDRQLVRKDSATFGPTDELANAVITQRDWLRSLPPSRTILGDIVLFHGTPVDDTGYLTEDIAHGRAHISARKDIENRLKGYAQRVFLCGHTHIPRDIRLISGQVIVNPGSVGLPAYFDPHPEPHIVETGSPDARYAILTINGEETQVEFISVPYDCDKAAEQARKNGQPICEKWLRTGFTE
jgi:putative phosphoesterase